MTKKEIAKQILDRKLEDCKKREFKEKEKMDEAFVTLANQIKLAREVNLINTAMTIEYLSHLEQKYRENLQSEQFKEYRDQVINFNDDITTERERLYVMRKQEKENNQQSMKKWEQELDKKNSSNSAASVSERAEITRDKENERENEKEQEKI